MGDNTAVIALGLMALTILWAVLSGKKDKKNSCTGCPNYNNCRAHIGCSNNPNYGK